MSGLEWVTDAYTLTASDSDVQLSTGRLLDRPGLFKFGDVAVASAEGKTGRVEESSSNGSGRLRIQYVPLDPVVMPKSGGSGRVLEPHGRSLVPSPVMRRRVQIWNASWNI
jgi:hypothetical protein